MPRHLTTSDISSTVQAVDTQLSSIAALSYTGNAEKVLAVNVSETGFELVVPTGGGGGVGSNTGTGGAGGVGGGGAVYVLSW